MENPYLFVEGDPVNYADPSGLAPDCELTIEFHVIDGRVRAAIYCANVPGGRLPPTYIHPQDFSRADASANFLSATGRGACGFCGEQATDVFGMLSTGRSATTTAIVFVPALASAVGLAATPGVSSLAPTLLKRTLVIGRGGHLARMERWRMLKFAEYRLSWRSKLPNVDAEKLENAIRLIRAMRAGRPIRDAASPDHAGGLFLQFERQLLRAWNWRYDASTGYWFPPL